MTIPQTPPRMPAPTRFIPPAQVDDAGLVAAVAIGDEGAFEQLYDRHAPRIHATVQRVLRDPAQSQEVTQEVLVEVWRLAPRYDAAVGSVATWIATIAHRRAVDRVRSVQASRDRDVAHALRETERSYDPVQELVLASSEQGEVRCAMAALTDLQRQAIELAYYGGHTHREVAELLGAPLGTVKSRIRDGLLRLGETLAKALDSTDGPCAPADVLAS